jgi:hypothetical protein
MKGIAMVKQGKRVNCGAATIRCFRLAQIQEHLGEEGRFAFFALCRDESMVSLFAAIKESPKGGCSGGCGHNHEVVLGAGERLL